MVSCLAAMGKVIADFGADLTENEFNIRAEAVAAAVEALTALLGDEEAAHIVVQNAGWL